MNKSIELQDLGLKDYKQTWDYQEQLFKGIVDTKINHGFWRQRKELNKNISLYAVLESF